MTQERLPAGTPTEPRGKPTTSPRSDLKSDYGDPDKNVALWVIDKRSTHMIENLILVCLKYTLYKSRFVLLLQLPTNRFTPSLHGIKVSYKAKYIFIKMRKRRS